MLLVEIAPLDRRNPGRWYLVRPLLFPGFHPVASFEARLVGLAAGGGVEVGVGAVPVLGKVLQSAIEVFQRELEDAEPGGRGRVVDNILIERLWRRVKYEDIFLREYPTVPALTNGLQSYLSFYNIERLHQSLGYRTPADVHSDCQGTLR
jgi:hypothetical protein